MKTTLLQLINYDTPPNNLRKKPGALAHSRAFQALNKTLKTLYNRYYTTREREFIMLLQLFNEYKVKDVCEKIKQKTRF